MATYTVTNNDDSGAGSLRAAIEAANAHEGDDNIAFDLAPGERMITLNSGQLVIDNTAAADTGTLVIDGDLDNDGIADITVDADGTSRVFIVQGDDAGGNNQGATLEGLIITGGVTTGSDDGGGVHADNADLTLIGSVITGNTVGDGGYGGGVFFDDNGILRITGSTISDNSSGEDGGGLFVEQALTGSFIERSTISGNETREGPGEGGGMRLFVSTIAVTNTTISGNRTLADNSEGGGARIDGNSVVVFTNATIADNHTYGTSGSEGGGVHMLNATVTFQNSIVAGNSSATIAATRDVATTDSSVVNSNGHNLFGQATVIGAVAGDLLATDPLLAGLADNGGPTLTMALLPGSLAIGSADPATAPDSDQRGVARDASPDIGAFELVLFTPGDDARDLDAFDLSLFTVTEATRALAGNDTVGLSETENIGLKFFGQGGDDTIAGSLQGDRIQGDNGADSVAGRGGNDTLWGKDDDDSVMGDRGGDTVYGGTGGDTVWGKDDSDRVFGDDGNDTVYGGNGSDSAYGGAGNDLVFGDAGNDFVYGGDGADSVSGAAGNDRISGDFGLDRLAGGAGADRFVFTQTSDSQTNAPDTITDFVHGTDTVDLSALGSLDFIGGAPFHGPDEVRVIVSAGHTLIQVNTEGSSSPEMAIAFAGVVTITESDLIL